MEHQLVAGSLEKPQSSQKCKEQTIRSCRLPSGYCSNCDLLIFQNENLKGHRDSTRRRLASAEDFILKHAYDRPVEELDSLMETSIEEYLRAGKESLERFRSAKIMVSKMICLEDNIIRFHPEWHCDDLNDADLSSFIERQLHQEEDGLPEQKILELLKTRAPLAVPTGLSTSEFTNSCEEYSCGICTENFKNQDEIAGLCYCVHEFHADCIKAYLLGKNSCPVCKALAVVPEGYPDWVGHLDVLRAYFKRDLAGWCSED